MRNVYSILLLACVALVSLHPNNAVANNNPDYQQINLNSFPELSPVSLANLDSAKPLYIKLWASWCQPCIEQMPHFQKLYSQYGDKVNFVAVNIDINETAEDIAGVISRFNLTMPVWLDAEGKLAVALGLVGTPYSVLINNNAEQVYSSHESDAVLDGFLLRLAKGQQLPAANTDTITAAAQQQLLQPYLTGEHTLFFTSTWCDWYLADSRPEMSAACSKAQQNLSQLAAQLPGPPLKVIVNHLWTDDKAVTEFTQKYRLTLPVSIDQHGVLFRQFNVRRLPTLVQIKDGKVVTATTRFNNPG